ncbi:MAG: PorP/SprF family type IX secretion system membrane protein [Chitinophagaceae bacterium]|nr:PorP/SprF family type IX secretion system membrane protein [Chitinophagaceae bacterium]
MKRILLLLFLFAGLVHSPGTSAQQDINFSQFYELPLLRNPALAGIFNGNVRFTAAYRNQWESITTPYRTMALGSEIKFFKGLAKGDFITAGMQITNDVAGDANLRRTQFLPVINYHKMLNEENMTFISAAFMGGTVSESFDAGKLRFDDQFVNGSYSSSNPTSQAFSNTSFNYLDASTGISFSSLINNNLRFYFGAGLFHFTRPVLTFMQDNEVRLNKKWVFNTGVSAYTSTYNRVVIYADHFMQGANRMTQGGFLFTHNFDHTGDDARFSLSGGAVYRWKDALIPVVKINTNKLSIGLSYDVNTSKLRTASSYRGGFELTLSYMDIWGSKNKDLELVECPIKNW